MQACTSLSLPSPPKVQTRRLQRAKVQWRARGSWTPLVRRLPKWKRERSRKPTRLTWVLSFNCRVLTFKFSNFCPTNTYYTVAGHIISCSGIPISPSYPLPLFLLSFLPPSFSSSSPPLLLLFSFPPFLCFFAHFRLNPLLQPRPPSRPLRVRVGKEDLWRVEERSRTRTKQLLIVKVKFCFVE